MVFKKKSIPWNKGKKLSEKHKINLSISHIGQKPNSGSFKKGCNVWNKGLKTGNLSKEHKIKISDSLIGIIREKITEEHKIKLSEALKGRKSWNKGKRIKESNEYTIGYSRRIAREKFPEVNWKIDKMCIHHKDGNPFNNDTNNLKIMNHNEHTKLHWSRGDIHV